MAAQKTKTRTPTLVFIVILLLLGVFVVVLYQKTVAPNPNATTNPAALPLLNQSAPVRTEVHSSDGTWNLIMQTEKSQDQLVVYSFFSISRLVQASGQTEQLILTKSMEATASMQIPANSWSPDNKLVFLEEKGSSGKNFLVLNVSGEAFSDGQPYLDVGAYFTQSKIEYVLDDATGWASPTLLIVTTKNGVAHGPSFWFDVSSHSFLQLSS